MDKRIVKIENNAKTECIIIITDAPKKDLEKWMLEYKSTRKYEMDYSVKLENRQQEYYNYLIENFYIKVLHNNVMDPVTNSSLINCDECYNLDEINDAAETFDTRKAALIDTIQNCLESCGEEILDTFNSSIVVKNNGSGPDFLITITSN